MLSSWGNQGSLSDEIGAPETSTPQTNTSTEPTPVSAAVSENPGQTNTAANPATNQPPVQASTVTADSAKIMLAKGLNPPHGMPGHRCDIDVGKPLASKEAPKTAAGLNPAHGQPGHRCDIAVGAPLDSKPAATQTTATKTDSASKLDTSKKNPVKLDTTKQ
jgi:hypothetical protein